MREPAVARKYAVDLFHASQKRGELDAVDADMASVISLLGTSGNEPLASPPDNTTEKP